MAFPADLPNVAALDDPGHITDHNTMRDAFLDLYTKLAAVEADVATLESVTAGVAPLGVSILAATTQLLPSGAFTPLTMTAPLHDDGGYYTVGSTTQLVVPAGLAGWHSVTGWLDFGSHAGGVFRYLGLYVNGSETVYQDAIPLSSADSGAPQATVHAELYLSDGDTLELQAYQNAGGASWSLAKRAFSAVRL